MSMTMTDSGTIAPAKLAEALAKAQSKITNPGKNAENPHFKSKYTNLAAGIDAIRLALSDNGLSITQTTDFEGELLILYTRLLHSSGEWIGSRWPVGAFTRLSPQQMGSALTYARRYQLFSITGISGQDEDDDGNAASHPAKASVPIPPPPPPSSLAPLPNGKRIPPKNWREETEKLFREAKTYDKLNSAHTSVLKVFNFDQMQLDEVEDMLMRESKKFFEEDQNA
jgi:ERF superfamily